MVSALPARVARVPLLFLILALGACGDSGGIKARVTPPPDGEPPLNNPVSRRPFFGDLHVHTKYSVDAEIFGTHNGPAEAYAFGRGATLDLGPIDPATPLNPVRLQRPLDFLAVTDHSEGFGLTEVCSNPASPGYTAPECQNYRGELGIPTNARFLAVAGAVLSPAPAGPVVCQRPGVDCPAAAETIWKDIQQAAAAANDPGRFTSFVAYEWTATPGNANLHRNVIFASEKVSARAISYTDTGSPDVTRLWSQLQAECKDGGPAAMPSPSPTTVIPAWV